jgi:hypothetical protein
MTDQQTAQQTFNEMLDSLTGFEEERIEDHFGAHIYLLLSTNASKSGRALIFIDKLREDMKSETADENKVVTAAKRHAQSLTLKEVNAYFGDDEDEPDPFGLEETGPSTESGKDGSDDENRPVSSPPSVS